MNVFGDAVDLRVFFADERPASMIDDAAKSQRADVIRPLDWRVRIGDDVFAVFGVKMSVLHDAPLSLFLNHEDYFILSFPSQLRVEFQGYCS